VGGFEASFSEGVEPPVRYHPYRTEILTLTRYPGRGQCQAGSLTGAVASKSVTEALKGSLNLIGNQVSSVKAEGSLTARPTGQAERKRGLSDPAILYGRVVAQRIKGTPGITG
jgi:hypothetical protein